VSIDVTIDLPVRDFELRVDFRVEGGITALFGPSGAGKTMTLRTIAGLTSPRSGRIAISGRPLFDSSNGIDVPARDRRIGYVFQQYALFPHLDVARNVAFGLHDFSRAERDERVTSLLSLVGLGGLERRRPGELSGGQQQRVALARALARQPGLVLLDEPFAAVDQRVRRRLRDELRRIHQATGTPMLLVTHDITEVRHLADFLVVIDEGRVLRAGPTGDVLASPGEDMAELIGDLSY
jgi:ABC-type sulfate/molybdate transport systems ATPase subunit